MRNKLIKLIKLIKSGCSDAWCTVWSELGNRFHIHIDSFLVRLVWGSRGFLLPGMIPRSQRRDLAHSTHGFGFREVVLTQTLKPAVNGGWE